MMKVLSNIMQHNLYSFWIVIIAEGAASYTEINGSSPENWYSVELEVNSNGKIIDEVNHCYSFGKINDETIFLDSDFPCPRFSNPDFEGELPYLGGGDDDMYGTIRIKNFEWLDEVTPTSATITTTTRTTTTTTTTTTIVPIDYFYGQ